MGSVKADTDKINEVAGRLNALADRLGGALESHETALSPRPAGSDEVSVRAASTMNEVHSSFRTAGDAGVTELREISQAVSTVAASITDTDAGRDFV